MMMMFKLLEQIDMDEVKLEDDDITFFKNGHPYNKREFHSHSDTYEFMLIIEEELLRSKVNFAHIKVQFSMDTE